MPWPPKKFGAPQGAERCLGWQRPPPSQWPSAPSSTRRQEVDRVEDLGGGHAFLRTEVELEHALDDVLRERLRVQVGRLHAAGGDVTVRFDGEGQNHLAAQARVDAQLAVVDAIQRCLVLVEDDLDLLVGTARAAPLRKRPVGVAHAGGDAAGGLADAMAAAGDGTTAAVADAVAATASAAATAVAATAATDGEVGDAAAAPVCLGYDERASAGCATGVLPASIGDLRVRSQFGRHVVVQHLREVVLECQHPRTFGLRPRLLDLGFGRSRGRGLHRRLDRFDLDLLLRLLLVGLLVFGFLLVLLDFLLGRRRRRLVLHHLHEAFRHFGSHVLLTRRQFPERRASAQGDRKQQREEDDLAETLGVITLWVPGHGHGPIWELTDLTLDQEFRFFPVLLLDRLVKLALPLVDVQPLVFDAGVKRITVLLEAGNLFVELRCQAARARDAIPHLLGGGLLPPEKVSHAQRIQFVKRLAYLGQKPALLEHPLQFALDAAHLVLKARDIVTGLTDLRLEGLLLLLKGGGTHSFFGGATTPEFSRTASDILV